MHFGKPKSKVKAEPKVKPSAGKQRPRSAVLFSHSSTNLAEPWYHRNSASVACFGDQGIDQGQVDPAAQSVPYLLPPTPEPAPTGSQWSQESKWGSKLDAVITSIDSELFNIEQRRSGPIQYVTPAVTDSNKASVDTRQLPKGNETETTANTSNDKSRFAKVNLYANSKLPPDLPPLKLYLPTWPLVCLAAQFSNRVYEKPSGAERETLIDADWRQGTKAMYIKSVPLDTMNTVVFAIRGTQSFMDWAVNLKTTPISPEGFLDDPGNLCHSGFLAAARKMIKPVAARLRTLLEENPSRSNFSLLIAGHSAGGAIASLLYSHMISETIQSELNLLTGCFKRIHCITFGAPPVSLLALKKPNTLGLRNSIFLSFINEGDPVSRADKAYVRSLVDLYATPSPSSSRLAGLLQNKRSRPQLRQEYNTDNNPTPPPEQQQQQQQQPSANLLSLPLPVSLPMPLPAPIWNPPQSTLSNAGRLILLRADPPAITITTTTTTTSSSSNTPPSTLSDDESNVTAFVTTDQQLRGVVFGDPAMHLMTLYARRVEILATLAVTAKWAV